MAGGAYGVRASEREIGRIMRLHDEGLNYEQIARRFNLTARTISRIVKREKAKRGRGEKQLA